MKLATFEARSGGKKHKEQEDPSGTGYLSVIKTLGKQYGFMEEPWLSHTVFTARVAEGPPPHATPAEIDALFKSPRLLSHYITSNLYDYVPAKYHELVDSSTFPDFRDNVCLDDISSSPTNHGLPSSSSTSMQAAHLLQIHSRCPFPKFSRTSRLRAKHPNCFTIQVKTPSSRLVPTHRYFTLA